MHQSLEKSTCGISFVESNDKIAKVYGRLKYQNTIYHFGVRKILLRLVCGINGSYFKTSTIIVINLRFECHGTLGNITLFIIIIIITAFISFRKLAQQ